MTVDNIVRLTSYLTDRSLAAANAAARVEALSGRSIPTTAIIVQTLDQRWLVEIEVVAAGGASRFFNQRLNPVPSGVGPSR